MNMSDHLIFDPDIYTVQSCELDGYHVVYRAFENLNYCSHPLDDIQKMNIFVPEAYYHGERINGYDLQTAPIFAQNTVGGYMPGPPGVPGRSSYGTGNAIFSALRHGYVVAAAGVRGRSTGIESKNDMSGYSPEALRRAKGKMLGKAPAMIVDMKAAIRYLRHNRDVIPGDTEHIITNGTSAGGALSALAGATGNSPDYEPYLETIGAARERDDVFLASCYCPIHNLENADAAYEWMFHDCHEYNMPSPKWENGNVARMSFIPRPLSKKQIYLSGELMKLFPAYVNSLDLKDEAGPLTLDENGEGTFKDYVRQLVICSAEKELKTHRSAEQYRYLLASVNVDTATERQPYMALKGKKVPDFDWDGFVKHITRYKAVPAFDALDLSSPENDEFGNADIPARHFTAFACEHSESGGSMAEADVIRMMNPVNYIGIADTAKYWWIRHGVFDRDTSLAIPVILALKLKNAGYQVNFELPWGLPHCGDYDLEDLFVWIDTLCGGA